MKRAEYEEQITNEIRRHSGDKSYTYQKKGNQTHSLLNQFGSQEKAIANARKLLKLFTDQKYSTHNPCTRVHELILELQNPTTVLKKLDEANTAHE